VESNENDAIFGYEVSCIAILRTSKLYIVTREEQEKC